MAIYDKNVTCFFERRKHPGNFQMPDVHYHAKHELYYLIEGTTTYFIEDELFLLNPGELIFVPKWSFHKTTSDADRILLMFDEDCIGKDYAKYIEEFSKNKHIVINSKHQNKIRDIMHKIEKEDIKQDADYINMQRLYLRELFILISRHRIVKDKVKFTHAYESIQSVAKYISANYTADLSLAALSAHFSISPNHLSKQFKKITGVGLNDYINITRIAAAEKLLLNTDMSVTEISLQCGFNDSNYFAAVFKKITLHTKTPHHKSPS